jgi:hypothetical protein
MTVAAPLVSLDSAPDLHHGSHNHLLLPVRGFRASLDAIIVPTFRAADALRASMKVAQVLECPLLALCSGAASAKQAAKLGTYLGVEVLAIDVRDVSTLLPSFRTDQLLRSTLFAHGSDLSLKRNLGLLMARLAGWDRVLFLDDDICRVNPEGVRAAAGGLDDERVRAVGLENTGYADNSVVCHAYRAVGAEQDSFIGGGAMVVRPAATRSFHPNIYNEDWLFLIGDGAPFKAGIAGSMSQRRYDPFANSERAAGEELGDTLAEGLYWLLDDDQPLQYAKPAFWGDFLYRRRRLFDHVLTRADATVTDARRREAIKASIRAARGRSSFITPQLCQSYVDAWRADLETWGVFIDGYKAQGAVEKAFAELGIAHVVRRSAL